MEDPDPGNESSHKCEANTTYSNCTAYAHVKKTIRRVGGIWHVQARSFFMGAPVEDSRDTLWTRAGGAAHVMCNIRCEGDP